MHKLLKFNLVAAIGILILTLACDKDQQSKVLVNSFNMSVNGEPWKPTGSVSDPCYGNYDCQWSAKNGVSFYNINATRVLMPEAGITNNNLFQLQIMEVMGPGVYYITEPYGDLYSYARFKVFGSGISKIYENSISKRTSTVVIDEMIKTEGSALVGIKGTFSGVLFNKENPNDSIVIDNSNFLFKRINWGDFCQCGE